MNAQTTTTKTKVSWKFVISRIVTTAFMIGTAVISFKHIVQVATDLGLTWEAWTAPFLVDGIAILGLIGRSKDFALGTRRAGLILVAMGGALSLACNVMAGATLGGKIYGVVIVVWFTVSEWYAGKLETAPKPAQTPAGRRCEPGCACGKHSPRKAPQRKPTARKPRAPRAVTVPSATEWAAMPSAPISAA